MPLVGAGTAKTSPGCADERHGKLGRGAGPTGDETGLVGRTRPCSFRADEHGALRNAPGTPLQSLVSTSPDLGRNGEVPPES